MKKFLQGMARLILVIFAAFGMYVAGDIAYHMSPEITHVRIGDNDVIVVVPRD
jgi:hypothetical protein